MMSLNPCSRSATPSLPARATAASVFSLERLYTEMGKPFSATFSARFCGRRGCRARAREGCAEGGALLAGVPSQLS